MKVHSLHSTSCALIAPAPSASLARSEVGSVSQCVNDLELEPPELSPGNCRLNRIFLVVQSCSCFYCVLVLLQVCSCANRLTHIEHAYIVWTFLFFFQHHAILGSVFADFYDQQLPSAQASALSQQVGRTKQCAPSVSFFFFTSTLLPQG